MRVRGEDLISEYDSELAPSEYLGKYVHNVFSFEIILPRIGSLLTRIVVFDDNAVQGENSVFRVW